MNNYGCIGYIKLAGKGVGMADAEIGKLIDEVYFQFDAKTETEAEQACHDIQLEREED